ncbi:DUF6527 family protein [Chryseobacterium cucumeris]|uniref:DUF6527 family protein n=1 Tax=Chryseobacterium cucumeris TaxID=1813611 RepID=UPI0037BE3F7B
MLQHKFVEFIPDHIEEGVIYISLEYCTAIHKCPCGCGKEVVTPISPTDWKLSFNGKSITLYPSIGNWNFKCQSHYWIRNNSIEFAGHWTKEEIERGRKKDLILKDEYFESKILKALDSSPPNKPTIWKRIKNYFK